MDYQKVKSVGKKITTKGPELDAAILGAMKTISDAVGCTLGPGGHVVLLERGELNLASYPTKDGVSVFRALGFQDATWHAILEVARDAAVRTATEAGDGTTTATILSEAFVRGVHSYCKANPKVSKQKVMRQLQQTFSFLIEPLIHKLSIQAQGKRDILKSVATISANGDTELAEKVLECFDLVGDNGNITISEMTGSPHCEVEKIEGFPIGIGYADSCLRYETKFINDPGNQRVYLEKPVFVLYDGKINEIQSVIFIMEMIGSKWQTDGYNNNVVLVANGFSDSVLAQLASNFAEKTTINVFPLLSPQSPVPNAQSEFLKDLAAVTGAKIFDTLNKPWPRTHEDVDLNDFGYGVKYFEAQRFRSSVVGMCDEVLIEERAAILDAQLAQCGSQLELTLMQERIGKLTGGIAKLIVVGASNGEIKERVARADDAYCAVRSAIKHGALPGGGWTLAKIVAEIGAQTSDPVFTEILFPSLLTPVFTLYKNAGMNEEEAQTLVNKLLYNASKDIREVYDCLDGEWVDAVDLGVLDSVPAVLEAIRNSISIATQLGILGATVVYYRDAELERREASDTQHFLRQANDVNPADERP